ncbi:MAG: TetR/AcrR family transcriptional regulator [Rhodospirillaceae bacterium]|nr:TetR/AcrR family transcriptional regulator [Rhodospirillaceae bacterium]
MIPKSGPAMRKDGRPRSRLKPVDRERMIVDEAMRYFADVGLGGSTSALAKRLGITQPLLFNYFPTKEDLISRIYDELMPHIWKPVWRDQLLDRSRPIADRLVAFYSEYAQTVLARDQFRLFLFAGIVDFERFGTRYNGLLRREIFTAIGRALKDAFAPRAKGDDAAYVELAHSLHGLIFHLAMRKWVYMPPLEAEIVDLVPSKVALFLEGAQRQVSSDGSSPRKR